nr:uncharacterized protein LOC111413976 [Onthophagus taurus]
MIKSDIPLNKLQSRSFREFLEKYCKKNIPDESTLRKNYVAPVYDETMQQIKKYIANNYIWFAVDETTDTCGRYVANLIIGVLNEDVVTEGFLISSKELTKTNSNTISRFVHDELNKIFLLEAVPNEKILLMLSDAAAYMIKAASNIKIFYYNLIHCTCLAHGLNRIAETIRLQYPMVNTLIKNGKQIFMKAPLRVQLFKETLPDIPLPPAPVLTRWGTWLDAAMYYADHFKEFQGIILEFQSTESKSIEECQRVLKIPELAQQLAFIKSHFKFVSQCIQFLEKQQLPLVESVNIIKNFEAAANSVPGSIGQIVKEKVIQTLSKNEGFQTLYKISTILNGAEHCDFEIDPAIIPKFKYAPITSVDVERSFSTYKNILTDRRHNFSMENLEKHLVIHSFKH